ncbi:hypothetical protein [Streptomyces sp. NPDC059080]|uniref:hypothetical protein n=1 Tax=Streptomyces sp. NPDC059080 TaxID=3346718 RepID=UPI003691AE4C
MRAQEPVKNRNQDAARDRPRAAVPRTPAVGPVAAMHALQRSIGNAAASRLMGAARHTHGPGCGHQDAAPVQRTLSYGPWSRKYLQEKEFMPLLNAADPGSRAQGIEAPFDSLIAKVEHAGRHVTFREAKPPRGRAAFSVEEGEGVLTIDPPSATATARELRDFATTLTHELQHAVDFVEKRFPADKEAKYDGDSATQRKTAQIAAELRAFGVEAAAAAKLAIGDTYEASEKPFSKLAKGLPSSSISPEQQSLVVEFQHLASYDAAGKDLLAAFLREGVENSRILNRLAAYLLQYGLMPEPGHAQALAWLRQNPKVVERGLAEGARLFHRRRPELKK